MEKPVPQFQWWDQLPQARLGLDFAIPQEPNSARTQGQNLDHLLNLISPSLSALAHLRSRPVVAATSTSSSSASPSPSPSAAPASKSPSLLRNIKPRVAPEGRVQSARLPRQVFDSLTSGSPSASPLAPLVPAASSSSLLSSPESVASPERKSFGERAADSTSPRGGGSGTWKPVVPPSRQLSSGGIGRRPVPASRRTITGGQGLLARATEEASQESRSPESPPSPDAPSSPGRTHEPSLSLARSRERVESPLSPGRAKPETIILSPGRSKALTEAPVLLTLPPVEPVSPKVVSPLPSPSALPPPPKPIARPKEPSPASPSPAPAPSSSVSPSQPVGRVAPASSGGRVKRRGAARPVSMSMVPLQHLTALAPGQSSSSSPQPPLRTAASDSQVNPLSPRSASQTAIDVVQSVNALQSLLKEIEVEYTEIMTSPHWFNVCDIVSNLRSHFNNLEKAKRSPE